MRRTHSLRFDALEARKLLTKAHVTAVHPAAAVAATPVVLTGTLSVNKNDAVTNDNVDGSTTTSVPVSGRLGTLGKVQGVWYENADQFGDYMGPDTIELVTHSPKGALTVAFNNQNAGPLHLIGHSTGYYQHAQRLEGGTGAFAKASENGSIEVMVSSTKKTVESLELISTNT